MKSKLNELNLNKKLTADDYKHLSEEEAERELLLAKEMLACVQKLTALINNEKRK